MTRFHEEQLAALLTLLPPAPTAWVQAAADLPRFRDLLESVAALADADAAFRAALLDDLERALAEAGFEPDPLLADALRERLGQHRA
jgi:hypothetical protein